MPSYHISNKFPEGIHHHQYDYKLWPNSFFWCIWEFLSVYIIPFCLLLTADETEEGEYDQMVEDQIEDNNNDQTDVTMEDNEQITAETTNTAMAAGDFSQFNKNNKTTTTTNTSAKTDMNPPNE